MSCKKALHHCDRSSKKLHQGRTWKRVQIQIVLLDTRRAAFCKRGRHQLYKAVIEKTGIPAYLIYHKKKNVENEEILISNGYMHMKIVMLFTIILSGIELAEYFL